MRTITDSNGDVVNKYDYTPFGSIYANNTTETISNRYQYTGREKNPVSGSMYYRHRTYEPEIGRWLTRDPAGYRGGIGLYSYVYNHPILYIDPTGLITWGEAWTATWNPWDAYQGNEARHEAVAAANNSGLPGAWNGPRDAFRHCNLNCRMTQRMGSACEAKKFADAHEEESSSPMETKMDLHNNKTGRQLAKDNPNGDCDSLCRNALNNGQLRQLRSSGSGPVPKGTPLTPTGGSGKQTIPNSPDDPGDYEYGHPGGYPIYQSENGDIAAVVLY